MDESGRIVWSAWLVFLSERLVAGWGMVWYTGFKHFVEI